MCVPLFSSSFFLLHIFIYISLFFCFALISVTCVQRVRHIPRFNTMCSKWVNKKRQEEATKRERKEKRVSHKITDDDPAVSSESYYIALVLSRHDRFPYTLTAHTQPVRTVNRAHKFYLQTKLSMSRRAVLCGLERRRYAESHGYGRSGGCRCRRCRTHCAHRTATHRNKIRVFTHRFHWFHEIVSMLFDVNHICLIF